MSELSNKEIVKKFKETEYGKKTNKCLCISTFIFFLMFIVIGAFAVLAEPMRIEGFTKDIVSLILNLILYISAIFMVYFDGKRNGAIEQYKLSRK